MSHVSRLAASSDLTEAQVVGKAAVRAAARLELPNTILAKVLGVSEASVSRMVRGDFAPEPDTKPFELAVLFVRLFRGLDAIVGGDAASARSWLLTDNTALRGKPISMIQTITGLTQAVQYVDARRARV